MLTLVETTLNTPVKIAIAEDNFPIITGKLEKKHQIRHAAGGFATIPAYFENGRLRLLPLFLYETETIDHRFLAYESSHIRQLLGKEGEYANYKEFFLNTPQANSSSAKKLAYLRHITRRELLNEPQTMPLLHPGAEDKTICSLIVYQLAERITWYIDVLEMNRNKTIDQLIPTLEGIRQHEPYYQNFDLVELFKQTMISLTILS